MSENPYQNAPSLPNPSAGAKRQKPAGLTVVPVFCLILGVLGILTGVAGLAGTIFQSYVSDLQNMQAAPEMAEFQAKMQDFQSFQFVPNLIVNACNLIVASLLVVGAVGVFGLKEWGRKLLRNGLLIAVIYIVLRGIYTAWMQYQAMDMMKGMMPAQGGGDPATFEAIMQAGIIFGIVVVFAWVAALTAFYLWSRSYLNRDAIVAFFRS